MKFEEWWEKKAPDITRALQSTNEYIEPYFKNAYEHGKAVGEAIGRRRCLTLGTSNQEKKCIN